MSTQNCFIDKISNEATAQLPAIEFRGEVRIVDHERDIADACEYLAAQPLIGFDTETRPSFRPGVSFRVSLLQLSTPERCYLFRLNRIPLAKPILAVMVLYYAVGHWNDFFTPLIYTSAPELKSLQLILRELLIQNKMETHMGSQSMASVINRMGMYELLRYAIIVVASVPVLCIYPFVQKHFVKGVMIGSIKG